MPSLSNEHFDLSSAFHVPESHSWPPSSLHDHPIAASTTTIPIIDISSPNAASTIGAACRSWGVFYATNHGVPADLLAQVESHARLLFSLPLHRKLLTARTDGSHSGFGRPPLSSFFPKLMWSEGFTLVGDPKVVTSTICPSSFCEVMEEYKKEMRKMAARIMRLMLLSLGLNEEEMGQLKEVSEAAEVIQLNSYPVCPEPERAIGMAAHTDSAFLTVLHQSDGDGGLQVLHCEDHGFGFGLGLGSARWIEVPHRHETLVVNVGDLLHILSNGQFKNVRHRAVVSRADHRISAAYFIGPPAEIKVGSIDKLVDMRLGPMYRPVTWPEYLGIRTRLFDKALDSVKFHEKGSEMDKLMKMENL